MNELLASLTIVTAFFAAAARADTIYTVTGLGTFGGASLQSDAWGINNQGQVIGWADDPTAGFFSNAAYWPGNGAPIQDLGTLDGQITSVSYAVAINKNGWVAGTSDNGNMTDAFLWTGIGPIQNLGTLGGTTSEAYGMNDAGTVVGGSHTASGAIHGFVFSNGVMRDTGNLVNVAINDSGQIAADYPGGNGVMQAYLVSASGQATVIGSLGGTYTYPSAINESGQVVGFSNTANGHKNAFLFTRGVLTDLGTIGDRDTSIAFGVNDYGDIVGESYYQLTGYPRAFFYSGGSMLDLNSLIDPASGWTLESANSINGNGQIVGIGISPNGNEQAFLLTPTPEPSAVGLLAAATCSLLIFRHYRRRLFPVRMSSAVNGIIATLTIVGALFAASARADTIYTVTDLGTLGGPNPYSAPTGINSWGQVTGAADGTVAGTGYAFLWTAPGPMVSLGALGSQPTQSNANAINDSSWVVGESNSEAFLYTPQTGMQGIGFLPGGTESEAYSLNNAGTIVGGATTVGNNYPHAFIWDATNGMRDLNSMIVNPPTGWTPNAAIVINQNGVIAGQGQAATSSGWPPTNEHAFILSSGSLTVIPKLGTYIQPEGMNASGEVVGFFFDANNQQHAFKFTALGGTRDIGNLGGAFAEAFGVSDQGMILGSSHYSDGSEAAFIYTDTGGMVDLNTLAPVGGWTLIGAWAINGSGQIAAAGYNGQEYHAFLLTPTPTPEPSTFGLLIIFACFILISQLCRRRQTRL